MKTKKSYTVSLIILLLLTVTVGLTSCSKDSEEQDAPTYYIKAAKVSNVLQSNTGVMFKIQEFIVNQYDEGANYIQADENTAKKARKRKA